MIQDYPIEINMINNIVKTIYGFRVQEIESSHGMWNIYFLFKKKKKLLFTFQCFCLYFLKFPNKRIHQPTRFQPPLESRNDLLSPEAL